MLTLRRHTKAAGQEVLKQLDSITLKHCFLVQKQPYFIFICSNRQGARDEKGYCVCVYFFFFEDFLNVSAVDGGLLNIHDLHPAGETPELCSV